MNARQRPIAKKQIDLNSLQIQDIAKINMFSLFINI